jgi:hypothetical protein
MVSKTTTSMNDNKPELRTGLYQNALSTILKSLSAIYTYHRDGHRCILEEEINKEEVAIELIGVEYNMRRGENGKYRCRYSQN